MKRLIVILTRFLRAADTSWMIAASMFVFCNCKNLITTNLHRFYCNISFPDKPQGRQVFWRGKGIWRLGKNRFIRTLSPQWKRLPFAGTRHTTHGGGQASRPCAAWQSGTGSARGQNNSNTKKRSVYEKA